MFCKTCGRLLVPKKTSYGQWLSCPSGHPQPELNQEKIILKQENFQKGKKIEIAENKNILAVFDHICKKCGHDKAEMKEIGAFYSDEDDVIRLKCGRCGHVEQMEGKIK